MCPPVRRRVFRPGYAADLVTAWLPALDGVVAKLDHATVADEPSIHAARRLSAEQGLDGRVTFETTLAPDGTCLIVEPNASADVLDVHPGGRAFMATSVVLCLPTALAQDGEHALGNHPGEETLRRLAGEAGLSRWKCVAETPVSRVYEARR
ncbi:hypothetical protein [Amycolatopsis sp. NPDC006125]|uniref:hypothetical protein n=1 Tax=Amycolatopsis sp. NPDC006125 TaxID=3156730 RepID=UPI0033B8A679